MRLLQGMVSKQFGKKGSKMMARMGGKKTKGKAPRAQDIFGGADDDGARGGKARGQTAGDVMLACMQTWVRWRT